LIFAWRDALLDQEVAELRHVVCSDAKDP
jgi:hypothetical protein